MAALAFLQNINLTLGEIMKNSISIPLVVLAAFISAPSMAASDHGSHGGHAAMQTQAPAEPQMIPGVVKKIDKAAGKVTVTHGPLVNLGMPAMTMVFRVKDSAWLDQMKDGDNIRFMADKVNGLLTLVHYEAVK
jgi:Cu(I)/Ag(I) efflux system protein CusF